MNYLIVGFSFFVIFVELSKSNFMSGFENEMRQFESNMDQFGQRMGEMFGGSDQIGGKEWLKQFANPSVPVFPANYPFPPQCVKIDDIPGLIYPEVDDSNVSIYVYPPEPIVTTIDHETFECTDPRYPDSFYMLKTNLHRHAGRSGSLSDSTVGKVKYYNKYGEEISYVAEVKSKPLWD